MITEEVAKKHIDAVHQEGSVLVEAFAKEEETEPFEVGYQRWYSRALPIMKQVAPDRYAEFQIYYARDPNRPVHWQHDYTIQDYLWGRESDFSEGRIEAARCFTSQLAILKSIGDRLDWMALDTEDQAARSLQLAELDTARDLIRISERAAGALAGTVLATYIRKLAATHRIKSRKQEPPLGELADALKEARVLDIPAWSQVTWLAELRTRCLRSEGEAVTKLQVRDLIDGTQWLIRNVF